MFPIWDDQVKWWYKPVFTWIIIAINVIVFMYQLWLSETWLEQFFSTYATQPGEIIKWQQRYSLLTSMFLHGWRMHIIWNMLFLYVFWDNIESRMGSFTFLVFYLLSGLVWSVAHVLTDTASMIPSLWASGAISWVLWAYLIMFPGSRIKILDIRSMSTLFVWASQFLLYWIWLQVLTWFWSLASAGEWWWVAYFAHIGWFAAWWIRWTMTRWKYTKWEFVASSDDWTLNNQKNNSSQSQVQKELEEYFRKR